HVDRITDSWRRYSIGIRTVGDESNIYNKVLLVVQRTLSKKTLQKAEFLLWATAHARRCKSVVHEMITSVRKIVKLNKTTRIWITSTQRSSSVDPT
ncbi:hypothetical protein L9F63_026699, partial [Diploptera punctata]